MKTWSLCLLLAGAVALRAASPPEFAGLNDPWLHFQSPNFELYSQNRENESRQLLHHLELFRAMFLGNFRLKERQRQEVTIYFFKSDRDFRAYVSDSYQRKRDYAGFYLTNPDRAVIYLRPGDGFEETRQLIFHEYGHHLFRVTEQNPPPWFDEGMAELFSTVQVNAGKMEFGHPVTGRLWQLANGKLLPLEQLFAVDRQSPVLLRGEHIGMFYSESWALMHYLYFGDSQIPAEKRHAFVAMAMRDAFKDTADRRAAFRDVFGMDYPEMEARLEKYVSGGGRYFWGKHDLPQVPPASTYLKRVVPSPELHVRLAELALRANQTPGAKLALLHAVDQARDDPRPLEVLGAEALREGNPLVAQERWTLAVERGTRNPAIFRELALMESRSWFSSFDPYFRMPADAVERLRGYLKRAIEYSPHQTDAYEMLAWVEAFAPTPSIANVMLVQKRYEDLTRKDRTTLALALVRVRLNLKDEALGMLADLEKLEPEPWVASCIEITRAYLEGRPVNREKLKELDARVTAPGQPKSPAGGN